MKPAARHKARKHATQALYQMAIAEQDASDVVAQHLVEMNREKVDDEYFKTLVHGVTEQVAMLDEIMRPYMNRTPEEMTPIELCVLRLATFELFYKKNIPYRVIINEALELNKTYGTSDGHKFVNGVLDQVAKKIRKDEHGKKARTE